jgi:Spy/CpxP family protein refolding chaperone
MALCSIAVAAGVVGVVALVRGLMFRRRFARFGGGGCGPGAVACGGGRGFRRGGWGGGGRWGGRWGWGGRSDGGIGRSFWLRGLFARLDTTPGQEKEIRAALEELREAARASKESLSGAREGLARAVKGDVFDEIAIGEAAVKLDGATGGVKNAFEAALRRIHAALDPKQRERLAALLERGPRAFRDGFGGPYRGGWQEF